ncbi:16S rRNA (guanine(527)-N(7))-methyltransferase RsmG [Beijerinckiaceae bacterium]|nr:16S rRNA (guanine(527)-N(7))-methyltransferase RsmG [Beijerinckiaceae bacterium]
MPVGRAPINQARSHPSLAALPEPILRRLEIYAALLAKWQRAMNLVGASTLDEVWVRHFADSLQVSEVVPDARKWLDLGSGAGFPGLVTAIRYADEKGASVHLVEANQRKCAFLREVARETRAPAVVHCGRIEEIVPLLDNNFEAVSARALASLPVLLGYAEKFIQDGAVGVFSKGKQLDAELTDSLTIGKYLIATVGSNTCSEARLVLVRRRP